MKTKRLRRLLALALVMVLTFTTVAGNTAYAASSCDCKKIVKLTAKTTGKMLDEGQLVAKSMVKKSLKVTSTYEGGKTKSKYTSYKVKQIGKVIKANSKGKYNVTITAGSAKKTVSIKVNRIKKIYIKQSKQTALTEGTNFDDDAKAHFKKVTTVYADYKKGADKKLTTYTVSAPSVVKADSKGEFTITVKYGNKKDTISIPVTKAPTTEKPTDPKPDTPSSEDPSKPENPSTEEPSKPDDPSTEDPTKPDDPSKEEVAVTISRNGEGRVTFNNEAISFGEEGTISTKVEKDSTCTLLATNTSEYKFIRWVDANNGTALSTDKSYTFSVAEDSSVLAVFERVYTLKVTRTGGKGKVTINEESLDFFSNIATYTASSGRYNMVAQSTDDYNFVSWSDANGKVLSTNPIYSISLSANVEVICNFAEVEKTINIIYLNPEGNTLISEAVPFGESLTPPNKDLWRVGMTFSGWQIGEIIYLGEETAEEFYDADGNSLSDAIKALTAQKQEVIVEPYYIEDPISYFTVNITGGNIVSHTGTVNAEGKYSYYTHMYIVADIPEGKNFAGWANKEGTIISYEEEYDFFVGSDITLTATFSDIPVIKEPVVHFYGNQYEIYSEDLGVRFYMASEIPENYTKIEWGFLYTSRDLDEETMKLGSVAKKVIFNSTGTGSADWTYDMRFPQSSWDANTNVKVRIYATVQSVEGTKTIYSNILSFILEQ